MKSSILIFSLFLECIFSSPLSALVAVSETENSIHSDERFSNSNFERVKRAPDGAFFLESVNNFIDSFNGCGEKCWHNNWKNEMRRQNQVIVYRQDGAILIMEDAIAVAVAKNICADVIHIIILQFLVKTRTTVYSETLYVCTFFNSINQLIKCSLNGSPPQPLKNSCSILI